MRKGFLCGDRDGPLRDKRSERLTWSEYAAARQGARAMELDRVGRRTTVPTIAPSNADNGPSSAGFVRPKSQWNGATILPPPVTVVVPSSTPQYQQPQVLIQNPADSPPPAPESLSSRKRAASSTLAPEGVTDMEVDTVIGNTARVKTSVDTTTTTTTTTTATTETQQQQQQQQQQQPYKIPPPVKQGLGVPKAALNTWCSRPPLRISLGESNYVTFDDGGRPHEKRYSSVFVDPRNGECFASGPWGHKKFYSIQGDVVWYTTKKYAEHGAAAVAYDCFTHRQALTQPDKLDYDQIGDNPPYVEPRQPPTAAMPPEVKERLDRAIAQARERLGSSATSVASDHAVLMGHRDAPAIATQRTSTSDPGPQQQQQPSWTYSSAQQRSGRSDSHLNHGQAQPQQQQQQQQQQAPFHQPLPYNQQHQHPTQYYPPQQRQDRYFDPHPQQTQNYQPLDVPSANIYVPPPQQHPQHEHYAPYHNAQRHPNQHPHGYQSPQQQQQQQQQGGGQPYERSATEAELQAWRSSSAQRKS